MQIEMGEIIKARREELNIPLVGFAKEAGISPGYLSQLENGRKTNPNLDVLIRITQALGIEIDELLGLEQEPDIPSLKMPSLLRLVIAKDRNMKVLEDKEIQKKVCNILDRALDSKYLIEDASLYSLFLEDVYGQMEMALKRYMAMDILIHSKNCNQ